MTKPQNVIGGVDTHSSTLQAAVIDLNGRELGDKEFPATQAGNDALRHWLSAVGTIHIVGIEGIGSYGAAWPGILIHTQTPCRFSLPG